MPMGTISYTAGKNKASAPGNPPLWPEPGRWLIRFKGRGFLPFWCVITEPAPGRGGILGFPRWGPTGTGAFVGRSPAAPVCHARGRRTGFALDYVAVCTILIPRPRERWVQRRAWLNGPGKRFLGRVQFQPTLRSLRVRVVPSNRRAASGPQRAPLPSGAHATTFSR